MKIAIVGASDSVDKIYTFLANKYREIKFILEKEDKTEKISQIVEKIKDEVDGIYLTGIGVYYALVNDNEIELDKPVVYTKRGNIGLIKSFWDFQKNGNEIENLKLGLDVVEEEVFLNVVKEFDIKLDEVFYQKYEIQKKEEQYLQEYLKKYRNKEINCVFTAFGYIYSVLREMNIPVYRIQATNIEIENEFKYLLNRIELINNKKDKIGIEIIKIDSTTSSLDSNLENKMKIEKKLLEYSKDVEGKIQVSDNKEYMIISNIEMLKNKENLGQVLKLKEEVKAQGEKLIVGIGEGNTIFQAEKNARIALKLSSNKEGNIFYSNGNKIKGPLLDSKEIEYKKVSNERIKNIAEEIGISPIYLEKIKGMIAREKKNEFTSMEIARILNITPRSVNRILKKIIEKNYAENIRMESLITAGRPRRVVKFNI